MRWYIAAALSVMNALLAVGITIYIMLSEAWWLSPLVILNITAVGGVAHSAYLSGRSSVYREIARHD